MKLNWFKYASPVAFYPLAGKLIPGFALAAAILTVAGLYISFFVAPTDFQQGESYRIIFIHVPAAWMSMLIYVVMAFWAGLGLVLNTRLSSMMATALAPTRYVYGSTSCSTHVVIKLCAWPTCCAPSSVQQKSQFFRPIGMGRRARSRWVAWRCSPRLG